MAASGEGAICMSEAEDLTHCEGARRPLRRRKDQAVAISLAVGRRRVT